MRQGEAFDGEKVSLSPESKELLERMLGAGTYGNVKTRIDNRLDKFASEGACPAAARLRCLARRVLPDDATLAEYHPLVARHKALVLFYVAGRLGKAASKLSRTVAELRKLARAGKR